MAPDADGEPTAWDGRPEPRVGRRALGMSGEGPGTSRGARFQLLRAYSAIIAFVILVDGVNVLTALHDAARRGESLAAWEPVTWEATSGIGELIASPIIYAAARFAPVAGRRWPAALPIHAGASLAFSMLHVVIMMTLRIAIYNALGFHYRIEAGALPYECRKDLLTYIVLAAAFHVIVRKPPAEAAAAAAEPSSAQAAPPALQAGENGLRRRLAVEEIVALKAAGNYVEVSATDGKRHLMRATLTELESRLAGAGVIRIHRSWLVNPRHVLRVRSSGSGDHTITLRDGAEAPLSRRFNSVVPRLKAPDVEG